MKKTLVVLAIAAAIAALASSCKVADPCPAYPGETSVEAVDSRI